MNLPKLKIADLVASLPIIQGGMAVRISTAPLAAAVANEGGIGVIAGTGMEPDELRQEIQTARSLTTRHHRRQTSCSPAASSPIWSRRPSARKSTLSFPGAGFSRDMFGCGREKRVPIVPIVSSPSLRSWLKSLGRAASSGAGTGGTWNDRRC